MKRSWNTLSQQGLDKYVNPDQLLDSSIDDQIEADDQAGELDSYMMQKLVVDTDNDPASRIRLWSS